MRTSHVGVRVADLQRSIAFYTALGYEVVGRVPATEEGSLVMLQLPDDEFVGLELVHDPGRAPGSDGLLNHLVVSVDDIHRTVAELTARGDEPGRPATPEGAGDLLTAWVSDPDGVRIELVQWPPGHPQGMVRADLQPPGDPTTSDRTAKDIVGELIRRQQAGDDSVLDDLVADDFVNHAAGPQGREGLRWILRTIEADLGPTSMEQHHLIGDGDLVAQHTTLHGVHHGSTMPLLAGVEVSNRPVGWTFLHIWRVAGGRIVEHWACRDDLGLLGQVRD